MVTPQDSADTPRFSVFHRETSELVKNVATFLQILLPLTSVSRDDQETNKTLGELKQREGGGVYFENCHPRKGAHTRAPSERAHAQHCWPADSLSSALPGNLPSSYISTTLHFLADSCTANMHN